MVIDLVGESHDPVEGETWSWRRLAFENLDPLVLPAIMQVSGGYTRAVRTSVTKNRAQLILEEKGAQERSTLPFDQVITVCLYGEFAREVLCTG